MISDSQICSVLSASFSLFCASLAEIWQVKTPQLQRAGSIPASLAHTHLLGGRYKSLIHIEFIHCIPKLLEGFGW